MKVNEPFESARGKLLRAVFWALTGLFAVGCDVWTPVQGRTFGTDQPELAGITMVYSEDELLSLSDGVRPLSGVFVEGYESDKLGFFEYAHSNPHVFMVPLSFTVRFAKDGYVSQSASGGTGDHRKEWFRVVLLKK